METPQAVDPLRVCPRGCLLLASDRFCPWHGTPVQSFVGRTVGNYVVKRALSDGGFGAVYLAANTTKPEFVVAMKILKPPLCYSQDTVDFFLKEAVATKGVTSVNIPVIHDLHRVPFPYITMELVDGVSLQELLATRPTDGAQPDGRPLLSCEQSLCVLRGIARALAASHAKGVIHRDLKPHNVMIRSDASVPLEDRVQVIDWGISLSLQKRQSDSSSGKNQKSGRRRRGGDVVGTFPYMATEAFDGRYYPQTDVYAFGVLACELLSGQKPYAIPSEADASRWRAVHESGVASKLPLSYAHVPSRVQRVISRCLAPDHSERYRDGRMLLSALESRRRVWPAAAAAAGVLLIVAALALVRGPAPVPLGATGLFSAPEWPEKILPPTWPTGPEGRGSASRVDFYDLRGLLDPTVFRNLLDPGFQTRLGLGGRLLSRVTIEQDGVTRRIHGAGESVEWTDLVAIVGRWAQHCSEARRPSGELELRLRVHLQGLLGGRVEGDLVFHWDAVPPVFKLVEVQPNPGALLPGGNGMRSRHAVPKTFRLYVEGDDEHSPIAKVEVLSEGGYGPVNIEEIKAVRTFRPGHGAPGSHLVTELRVEDLRTKGQLDCMKVVLSDLAGNKAEHPARLCPDPWPLAAELVSAGPTLDGAYEIVFRAGRGVEPRRDWFEAYVTPFEPPADRPLPPDARRPFDLDPTAGGLYRLRVPLGPGAEQWVTVLMDEEGKPSAELPNSIFLPSRRVDRGGPGESGGGEGSR